MLVSLHLLVEQTTFGDLFVGGNLNVAGIGTLV